MRGGDDLGADQISQGNGEKKGKRPGGQFLRYVCFAAEGKKGRKRAKRAAENRGSVGGGGATCISLRGIENRHRFTNRSVHHQPEQERKWMLKERSSLRECTIS